MSLKARQELSVAILLLKLFNLSCVFLLYKEYNSVSVYSANWYHYLLQRLGPGGLGFFPLCPRG